MLTEVPGVFDDPEKRVYCVDQDEYILIEMNGDIQVKWIDSPSVEYKVIGDVGSFDFKEIEEEMGPENYFCYKVIHMDLSGCERRFLKRGIGTEVLKIKEEEGHFFFAENDGLVQNDGSHLIDDGVGFVQRVNQKKRDGTW